MEKAKGMGLDGMVEEIMERGRRDAAAIRAEAEAEHGKAVAEARRRAAERFEKAIADAKRAAELERKHELSSAELEMKRSLLAMQKATLAKVLDTAGDRVKALPPDKGRAVMKQLITAHKDDGTRVQCRSQFKDLVTTLTGLCYVGDVPSIGGVIIEDEKGEVRHDHTFDTILREAYEARLNDIYGLLFRAGEGGDGR